MLEKRSKRRERERLVHERFKLKHLVERLRGEANSAAQFAPTGRSRENDQRRQQQLDEAEATLRRLDELLQIPGTVGGRATSSQQLPAAPEERERAQARAQARSGSRRAPAVVEAPSVSLKIRLTRDGNGRLSAASSSPPPAELAARPTRHPRRAQRRSRFEEIDESADEDYAMDVDEVESAEHDSLFATPLLREQHFRPLVVAGQPAAKARKSARAVWAWGQRLPEAACATARDFDEVGTAVRRRCCWPADSPARGRARSRLNRVLATRAAPYPRPRLCSFSPVHLCCTLAFR